MQRTYFFYVAVSVYIFGKQNGVNLSADKFEKCSKAIVNKIIIANDLRIWRTC